MKDSKRKKLMNRIGNTETDLIDFNKLLLFTLADNMK